MEQLVRLSKHNNPITFSRLVAQKFGKRHDHVLRDIERVIKDFATATEGAPNFGGTELPTADMLFAVTTYTDSQGKTHKEYAMTVQGFRLLAMRFTGVKALRHQLEFIAEFERLQKQVELLQQTQTATDPVKVLQPHVERGNQLENSKKVAGMFWRNGGTFKIIEYNRLSCLLHTGKRPNVIKSEAKAAGLPSKFRGSAKEVLRHTQPELAACMSLCDDLTSRGIALSEAATVSLMARDVYAGLLRLGVHVPEVQY